VVTFLLVTIFSELAARELVRLTVTQKQFPRDLERNCKGSSTIEETLQRMAIINVLD